MFLHSTESLPRCVVGCDALVHWYGVLTLPRPAPPLPAGFLPEMVHPTYLHVCEALSMCASCVVHLFRGGLVVAPQGRPFLKKASTPPLLHLA